MRDVERDRLYMAPESGSSIARTGVMRRQKVLAFTAGGLIHLAKLGACLNSHCSILGESDSTLGYEQVFSPLEYRSDAASAAECAGLCAERPCLAVYR